MAVTYGFFNSVNGDRKYNADQMSEYFRGIVSQGVFQHLDSGLAVSAGTGLSVSVAAGRAIIQDRWIQNSAALNLTISAASETYGRKDAVVIRLDKSSRAISITVKTGTPAASPVAPSMTRNATTYEMALAYVNVAAGASSVTVTDKRSDSSVCGWAAVAQATSGEVDQMLNDMKTGFDGVVYSSPAEQVQGSDTILENGILSSRDNFNSSIIWLKNNSFPVEFEVENGDIDGESGADIVTTNTRLRTVGYIDGNASFLTVNKSRRNYKYRIFYYDSSKTFVSASPYLSNEYDDNLNPSNYPYLRFVFFDYTNDKWNNNISVVAVSNYAIYKTDNALVLNDDDRIKTLPYCTFAGKNGATIDSVQNEKKSFESGLKITFDSVHVESSGRTWQTLIMHIYNPDTGRKVHFHYEKTPSNYRTARINYHISGGSIVEGTSQSDTNDIYEVIPNRTDIDYIEIVIYLSNNTAEEAGSIYYINNIAFEYYNDGIIQQYPPYLMNDILANLKYYGDDYNIENQIPPFVLLHFSDVHASVPALKRLKKFKDTYSDYIDDVVFTGDAVKTVWENGFDFWSASNADSFLFVLGNHDCWTWGDSYTKAYTRAYSAKQCYERYISPFASQWGGAVTVSNKCYWYKDYPDSKIRLISVDCMHWNDRVQLLDGTYTNVYKDGQPTDNGEQKTWLEGVLADAKENDLSVICAVHYPAYRTPINCTFMSLNAFTLGELQEEIIQTVQDFIDDGGSFITWLSGHNHEDLFGTINNYPDQLMIAITDSYIGESESNVIHLPNTYGESNYNLFSVDTNHGYVRIMRIGGNYDRNGRRIGSIVYDYINKTLIWNN